MKTILLVEDDAALRQMVQRMLVRLPCRLLQAGDGATAVALARQE
jgi:two-component system, cell cycle response regulator DivK